MNLRLLEGRRRRNAPGATGTGTDVPLPPATFDVDRPCAECIAPALPLLDVQGPWGISFEVCSGHRLSHIDLGLLRCLAVGKVVMS